LEDRKPKGLEDEVPDAVKEEEEFIEQQASGSDSSDEEEQQEYNRCKLRIFIFFLLCGIACILQMTLCCSRRSCPQSFRNESP
jgi:hypothetical protein